MTRKTMQALFVAVLAVAFVALAGCAKVTGSGSESSVTLPDGFPADVPVYDGRIVESQESETGGGSGYVVDVAAPDAVGDVVSWYETELAGEGWVTATASTPNGTGNVITGDKEGQSVTVTVLEGDGGTDVSIEYAPAD